MIRMIIGNHFGKHKPEWNFFTTQYQRLMDSSSKSLIKIVIVSFAVQFVFFIPVLYWIFQNYQVLQTLIPQSYNLSVNFEFEKKWILFLVISSVIASSVWNAIIWYNFYKFKIMTNLSLLNQQPQSSNEPIELKIAS